MIKEACAGKSLVGVTRLSPLESWCLFGVYYRSAPERLKRIKSTSENNRKLGETNGYADLVDAP